MNIDTVTLKCFLAIADTGSFTQAAQRVGRTQSAVSQQIAKLENCLGTALIERGKTVHLTNEGEIFLGYARRIFALHSELIDRFKEPELTGEVRFGLPESFASVFLSEILVHFAQIHPRIMLIVDCDLTLNLYERFKQKEFDLVLLKMSRPEDFPNGVEVWSEKLEWIGDKNLVNTMLQKEEPIPLVLSPAPCVYRASAIGALEKAGLKWRQVFSSPSYAGTNAAVKAGLGISVLPKTMIPAELNAIDGTKLPTLSDSHISLLKQNPNNSAVLTFEEFVLKKLKH
ncbi:MAG: LysR family transcriptional regulator [Gammaproteobacteria bacterium]|nr:LysR family transcriptional regulator [Gammaproteobacteria bacterium]